MEKDGTSLYWAESGLNPYYNGRYSWSNNEDLDDDLRFGLNPYYNGRYSWSSMDNMSTSKAVQLS